MAGPSWRASLLAAVMIMIALFCAGRLAISLVRRRKAEFDTDGVHAVMGVAMAGMFLPRLSLLPPITWEAIFGAGAAWFAVQVVRSRGAAPAESAGPADRADSAELAGPADSAGPADVAGPADPDGPAARGGWRCRHPLPHLVECVAMLYMLLSLPGARAGSAPGTGMAGMAGMGGTSASAANLPALPAVLALFMVGYLVWIADQLTSRARRPHAVVTTGGSGGSVLAPRFASFAAMGMSMTMGYMLVLMI